MVRPRAARLGVLAPAVVTRGPAGDVPDAELVKRARGGERWAEEAIFRKHVDHVAALSQRLLRNAADADDAVQDTFLDAFAQLRETAPASLRSWLAGIAVHKAHRRFRKRRLLALLGLHHSSHDAALEAQALTTCSPELRAELGLLDVALARVTDVDRAAWVLRHVDGYVLEEVAALCRCSLATVKRRIQRAHAVVKVHLDVEGADDE